MGAGALWGTGARRAFLPVIRPECSGRFQVCSRIQVKEAEKIGVERSKLIYGDMVDAKLLQWYMNSSLSIFQRPNACGLHLLSIINRVKRLEKSIGLHRNSSFIALHNIRQLKEPVYHFQFQERQIAA